MRPIVHLAHWLGASEEGATMVEYGLTILFIAIACFAAVQAFGGSLNNLFTQIDTNF